ncbi:DNA-binding transcription factor [Lithospermum erythrorhizon]|uniref:DNA-binding transcription factor n=1 Tax=Lithospermum erythrorhizon TaxID=34254 RepID=A0AAV3Q3F1_LITER
MTAFEQAINCLRLLVKTNAWDYCIVWQIGDDPSRFIQWCGCCCSGGYIDSSFQVTEESGREENSIGLCKDINNIHPAKTTACKALAQYPSSFALYTGIHGETIISRQPRWIIHANSSTPDNKKGTHVLVPLDEIIIELFTTKQVPRDQNTIDFISTLCVNFSIPKPMETLSPEGYVKDKNSYTYLDDFDNNSLENVVGPFVSIQPQAITCLSFEGSSASSSYSVGNKGLHYELGEMSKTVSPECSNGDRNLIEEKIDDYPLQCIEYGTTSDEVEQKKGKEPCVSKNLLTERRRRKKINAGLLALRALVPNITKMDKASTLGDACVYIQDLLQSIRNYEDELTEMKEEDCCTKKISELALESCNKKEEGNEKNKICGNYGKPVKEEIDVIPISPREFLVKIICKQMQCGFTRLLEAANAVGLEVIDVNVTTLNGMVLNNLKVVAHKKNVEANNLKDSLTRLIFQEKKKDVGASKT